MAGTRRQVYNGYMSRWVLGAIVATACLVPSMVSGQVALGVARTAGVTIHRPDPPQPPPAPPRSGPPFRSHVDRSPDLKLIDRDLFRAGPDTYAPDDPTRRPGRVPRRSRVHPYRTSAGYFPTPYVPGFESSESVTVNIAIHPERAVTDETEPLRRERADATPEPAPAPISPWAAPKTFYVVPRCYAGDRRPSADQLPAGCDITLLRVIPSGAP